ncbi:MAG: hypothetical protein Q9163_000385 [Psora crenata]
MTQEPAAAIAPISARAYVTALPVLDKDIFHFPADSNRTAETSVDPLYLYLCSEHESSSNYINTSSGFTDKLDYHHHLQYFLYGAMCYMALKDWDRAILFLEVVLTSPTPYVVSRIQVEAYKKWVLLNLLHRGKKLSLPKTVNSLAVKTYQNLSKPYIALANIFVEDIENEEGAANVVAEVRAGQQIFMEECNLGLVRQVINAYRQFSVQRLEKTCAALTISEVSRRTSENPNDHTETGRYVIGLISSGLLNAAISQSSEDPATWVLRFCTARGEGLHVRSEEQQYDELVRQAERIRALQSHVKEADRKYGLSKEYIQEVKRLTKAKDGVAGNEDGSPWYAPGYEFDHDEDMMADQ